MTTRRGFLAGVIAAGIAPAFIKSEILMPVKEIIIPKMVFITEATVDSSHPLDFGNMVWKPELTLAIPISQGVKELAVNPRFPHIESLPVMGFVPSLPPLTSYPIHKKKEEDFNLLNFIRRKVFS